MIIFPLYKNIFAGTVGNGVWKRLLSEITAVNNETEYLPEEFILFQNYPNPFNPSTRIKYTLSDISDIIFLIYNPLGVLIKESSFSNLEPGVHYIDFDGSNLSSGIYFYSISTTSINGTKNQTAVRKMILLK